MAQLIASGYLAQASINTGSGAVAVSSLHNWSLTENNAIQTAVASNTANIELNIAGNYDWTGEAQFYGYEPPVLPGTTFTFLGCTDGTANTAWTSGSSGAICTEVTIDADHESGTPFKGTIRFAQAAVGLSTTTGTISDSSLPEVWSPASRKIIWGVSPSTPADVPVRGWSITLRNQCPTYVDTDTGGKVFRKAGNKSASGTIKLYEAAPASVLRAGACEGAKFYVTNSTYWHMDYLRLGESTQAVNRETGEIVGVDHSWQFTGFKYISSTYTRGRLVTPGTTAYSTQTFFANS